jgi:hypothetical protein
MQVTAARYPIPTVAPRFRPAHPGYLLLEAPIGLLRTDPAYRSGNPGAQSKCHAVHIFSAPGPLCAIRYSHGRPAR